MTTTLRTHSRCGIFYAAPLRAAKTMLIYVVDDEQALVELYTLFLKGIGYSVKAFTERADALAALILEPVKPDLLITDYVGFSMAVDEFIRHCREAHPGLRILMASGCLAPDEDIVHPLADRFIQKPFTAEELQREVQAALAA